MGFLEKRYNLANGRKVQSFTAYELYQRVLEETKKRDYNWFSSIYKILDTCSKPDFPIEYSIKIKCAILDSISNFILNKEISSKLNSNDLEAAYDAYNSLPNYNLLAKDSKVYFLKSIILSIIKFYNLDYSFKDSKKYHKFCLDWLNNKCSIYINEKYIDFPLLIETLEIDFDTDVNNNNSLFKEERKNIWNASWTKIKTWFRSK